MRRWWTGNKKCWNNRDWEEIVQDEIEPLRLREKRTRNWSSESEGESDFPILRKSEGESERESEGESKKERKRKTYLGTIWTSGDFDVAFCMTRNSFVTISMTCPDSKTKAPFRFVCVSDCTPSPNHDHYNSVVEKKEVFEEQGKENVVSCFFGVFICWSIQGFFVVGIPCKLIIFVVGKSSSFQCSWFFVPCWKRWKRRR